jgi:hypothetical protein
MVNTKGNVKRKVVVVYDVMRGIIEGGKKGL